MMPGPLPTSTSSTTGVRCTSNIGVGEPGSRFENSPSASLSPCVGSRSSLSFIAAFRALPPLHVAHHLERMFGLAPVLDGRSFEEELD